MRPLIGVRFERTGGGVPETRRSDALGTGGICRHAGGHQGLFVLAVGLGGTRRVAVMR